MAPPTTGPRIGARRIGTPAIDITRPTRCGPALWARRLMPTGMIIPPPNPCSTRKKISELADPARPQRSEEHTSELQSPCNLVCRLLLEKKKKQHPDPRVQRLVMVAVRSRERHGRVVRRRCGSAVGQSGSMPVTDDAGRGLGDASTDSRR